MEKATRLPSQVKSRHWQRRQNLMVSLTLLAKRHPISRTGNFSVSSPCISRNHHSPKPAKSAEEADALLSRILWSCRGHAGPRAWNTGACWDQGLYVLWPRKCYLTCQTHSPAPMPYKVLETCEEETKKLTLRPSLLKLPSSCSAAGGPSPHSPHRGIPRAFCGLGLPLPDSPASN